MASRTGQEYMRPNTVCPQATRRHQESTCSTFDPGTKGSRLGLVHWRVLVWPITEKVVFKVH